MGAAPGPRRGAALLAAVALLAACLSPGAAQSCSDINVKSQGAKGDGSTNDAGVFSSMNSDGSIGMFYMPAGTYRIASSITLSKPIVADKGAVFSVASGVTLSLASQPDHPLSSFFTGAGTVSFLAGTVRAFVEWFGAAGDGVTDDASAIRKTWTAVSGSGAAMLYFSASTYAIGSELTLGNGATVMSEAGARLLATGSATKGVSFPVGGAAYKTVLPHIQGFSAYCLNLAGTDLAAIQLQSLVGCGDAIRVTVTPGTDVSTVLDNTIWFDYIQNSRYGIAVRAASGCTGSTCVVQGNQFIGNKVVGGATSGASAAVYFYFPGTASQVPAWDSNQFNFAKVQPPTSNSKYAMVSATPLANRCVVKVGTITTLASGAALFSGTHNLGQYTLGLGATLAEGGLGLYGQLDLVQLTGKLTPASTSTVVTAVTASNKKSSFNGGKALVGNFFSMRAIPASGMPAAAAGSGMVVVLLAVVCARRGKGGESGTKAGAAVVQRLGQQGQAPHPSPSPTRRPALPLMQTGPTARRRPFTSTISWPQGTCTRSSAARRRWPPQTCRWWRACRRRTTRRRGPRSRTRWR